MKAERSQEIDSRLEFPILMSWRRLYGHAIEVGVDRGTFSHHLLTCWPGASFFGVDSYESDEEFPGSREADFLMATHRYEQFGSRARLLRMDSTDAAKQLGQIPYIHEFDFIYIDAGHSLCAVASDLCTWWPLVSERGILAGHDYDETHPGVIQAVDEFFAGEARTVYVTHEASCPSWYVYKSGMPVSDWRRIPHAFEGGQA